MAQINVFWGQSKSNQEVLNGVFCPGPFFPLCFRKILQRESYKHFDLVLEGVSSMLTMLKLRDV